MALYIHGMGNISPQKTWGEVTVFSEPLSYAGSKLTCVEPDYSPFIEAKHIRRMSRIIKMGVASAAMALKEADVSMPDAIITGTGYGCLEDTGIFLSKMITNKEEALNPTPFIQSTHNTIGSQIALLLQCQSYNQTYSQGAFSFESALLDAWMQLSDSPEKFVLVGGVDEVTSVSHDIHDRFGIFRNNSKDSLDLLKTPAEGIVNGEGSAFFVLSGKKQAKTKARIEAVTMLYKPGAQALHKAVGEFVRNNSKEKETIDLVMWGKSGNHHDHVLDELDKTFFLESSAATFKNLCGEYSVASAFALWLAAEIIKENRIPESITVRDKGPGIRNIVIINQYFGTHYSLIHLRAC
jgi:3-oxoacyl-(acyl-carrier-protein) synthase